MKKFDYVNHMLILFLYKNCNIFFSTEIKQGMINAAFNCFTFSVYTCKIKITVMANRMLNLVSIFNLRQKYALMEDCSSINATSN